MSLRRNILRKARTVLSRTPIVSEGPSRLTFRFGKRDLPSAIGIGKKQSLASFQGLIADYVQAQGSMPVHFIVDDAIDDDMVYALLRFAHRLGCPTEVLLNGAAIDESIAQQLLFTGVDSVWMLFGGVSAEVHYATTGVAIEESTQSIQHLIQTRNDTEGLQVQLGLLIPWKKETPSQASAVKDWALELGVDTVQPHFPYMGSQMSKEPLPNHQHLSKWLNVILQDDSSKPGWKRRYPWSCPVGQNRLEVSKYGRVCSCPHKTPILWKKGSLKEVWSNLGDHRQEIHQCDRVCLHRDLRF